MKWRWKMTGTHAQPRSCSWLVPIIAGVGATSPYALAQSSGNGTVTVDLAGMAVQYPGTTTRTSATALCTIGRRYTFQIEGVYDNPVLPGPVFLYEIFSPSELGGEMVVAPGTVSFNVAGSQYTYYRVVNNISYFATVTIAADTNAAGQLEFTAQGTTEHPELFPDATITSGSVTLTEVCYADCDLDTALNIFDLVCFGNRFAASDVYADCDLNGQFTVFDYICFTNLMQAGCQ